MTQTTRRELLSLGAASAMTAMLPARWNSAASAADEPPEKLPVAAVVTEYRPTSHADVILGKILDGYLQNGGPGPGLKLVSLYTDQVPDKDISRSLAQKFGFRLASTIDDAITLGSNEIQVAGVLSIGEHGNYPRTSDTGQHMYPRRRFFDEIVATFRRCGKSVPVFNDKHLGYRWDDAKFMVDTARQMRFPLLAGSSVPLAWRRPVLDLPQGCEIEAAVTVGYGGLEAYGFHALEAHECLLERRQGGESGIQSVRVIQGSAIEAAQQQGAWSTELFAAALRQMPRSPQVSDKWIKDQESAAFLMEHRDGLKSAVLMANGISTEFATAIKLKGEQEPVATWFQLQSGAPFSHFAYLVDAIEQTIRSGKAPIPIERTLLTTGILDRLMHSLADNGRVLETPELNFTFAASDWPFANHPKSRLNLPNP